MALFGVTQEINQNVRFLVTSGSSNASLSTFSNELQLNKNRKTVFIVHGWLDGESSAVRSIERSLLSKDKNVQTVFVDWSVNSIAEYSPAVSSIPSVGRAIAAFANNQGLNVRTLVHCIGHSLGAHVCGFAGKYLQSDFNEKMARISALDAAGPSFNLNAPRDRVAKTDATFVDAIHTDKTNGVIYPIGHHDFYPNGGNNQPDCNPYGNATYDEACNHERVIYLYEASVSAGCQYSSAVYCGQDIVPVNSDTPCVSAWSVTGAGSSCSMGYFDRKDNREGSFYLQTLGQYPFCFK